MINDGLGFCRLFSNKKVKIFRQKFQTQLKPMTEKPVNAPSASGSRANEMSEQIKTMLKELKRANRNPPAIRLPSPNVFIHKPSQVNTASHEYRIFDLPNSNFSFLDYDATSPSPRHPSPSQPPAVFPHHFPKATSASHRRQLPPPANPFQLSGAKFTTLEVCQEHR